MSYHYYTIKVSYWDQFPLLAKFFEIFRYYVQNKEDPIEKKLKWTLYGSEFVLRSKRRINFSKLFKRHEKYLDEIDPEGNLGYDSVSVLFHPSSIIGTDNFWGIGIDFVGSVLWDDVVDITTRKGFCGFTDENTGKPKAFIPVLVKPNTKISLSETLSSKSWTILNGEDDYNFDRNYESDPDSKDFGKFYNGNDFEVREGFDENLFII
jgi:hypothetical protein